ncbi:MAG: hypothetical protein JOY92_12180 [Verrucomicrobia bacterium]|nr:hypothetical protein [Verrucomicrobiota bacterium]
MRRLFFGRRHVAYWSTVLFLVTAGARAADPLEVKFNQNGISSLVYNGQDFLGHAGKERFGEPVMLVLYQGDPTLHYDRPGETTWPEPGTLARVYPWGSVRVHYEVHSSDLDISVEVHNGSAQTMSKVECDLFYVEFPGDRTPDKWDDTNPPRSDNQNGPTVLIADYGTGKLVAAEPMASIPTVTRWGSRQPPGRYQLSLQRPAPLAPGETVRLATSCRFRLSDAAVDQAAADIFRAFRERHPQELVWPDRRPIGSLILARASTGWPTNPRGWFNDRSINVTTPAGRVIFFNRLFDLANGTLANLRAMNAQGIIVWDIEGQQYPQGEATYAGDPRLVAKLAPEMEPVADDLFAKFSRAQFRTGVCLRADAITFRANGSFYQKPFTDRERLRQSLDERIAYARSRWGCTLFYIDSYGGSPVYEPGVLKELHEKYPDVLLIPEFEQTLTYACTAPYKELRSIAGSAGTAISPWQARAVYPHCFTVINTADGDVAGRYGELVRAVRRGDVLLFRAWWRDRDFNTLRSILAEAGPVGLQGF